MSQVGSDGSDARERLAHLRGALRLVGVGVERATGVARDIHRAIAAAPLEVLAQVPVARVAGAAHAGVSEGVYAGVRGISRLVFATIDRALALGGPLVRPPPRLPGPLVGLLHGVVGDHIVREDNPLRTEIQLRHAGRELPLQRAALAAALPGAGARVVLFVHGLAADESCWRLGSARAWGREDVDYGSLLAERRGFTPLYLRYNSGLRIADNGRALAELLRQLVEVYPGLRELVLVGHSMGGLVVRSACHHGRVAGSAWTGLVRDVVYLGAPHRGAVLEKVGAVAVAAMSPFGVTAPIARALEGRSAGIKDLRSGTVCEAGEEEVELPGARHHYLAGTIGNRPLAWAIGDGLVRVPSATPEGCERSARLAGVGHVDMLNHPEVFAWLEAALTGGSAGSGRSPRSAGAGC